MLFNFLLCVYRVNQIFGVHSVIPLEELFELTVLILLRKLEKSLEPRYYYVGILNSPKISFLLGK
jgi:hypothetical protein